MLQEDYQPFDLITFIEYSFIKRRMHILLIEHPLIYHILNIKHLNKFKRIKIIQKHIHIPSWLNYIRKDSWKSILGIKQHSSINIRSKETFQKIFLLELNENKNRIYENLNILESIG